MNKKMVGFIIGRILMLEAGFMVLPLIISFIYNEPIIYKTTYFSLIVLLCLIGFSLSYKLPKNTLIYGKEGLVIVSLSWILLSLFGALPFVLTRDISSYTDAFFEIVSGFTTTGLTLVNDISTLSKSNLFWRNASHFVGGMGVLVLAIAIFPRNSGSTIHVMKAEVPGPIFGKLMSKLTATARVLYKIYVSMTIILIILLLIGGLNLYDSTLIAFSTAGTGGFSVTNESIGTYNSTYIDIVVTIGMFLFGVNFNIFYFILIGKLKDAFNNEELKYYISIIVLSVILIVWNVQGLYSNILICIRDVFFTVISIITTTGLIVVNFQKWPLFTQTIIILLMFIGGCSGSTAGGIKVSRIIIMIKMFFIEIINAVSPNRHITLKFEHKKIDLKIQNTLLKYLLVYIIVYNIIVLLLSFEISDYYSVIDIVTTSFNNVGISWFDLNKLTNISKWIVSFSMLLGRLEILPILILFIPSTWKK